jgi:hypothetical protein
LHIKWYSRSSPQQYLGIIKNNFKKNKIEIFSKLRKQGAESKKRVWITNIYREFKIKTKEKGGGVDRKSILWLWRETKSKELL